MIDWFANARGGVDAAFRKELIERFEVTQDRRIHELSKGNRQKIGLVLAFMHRPELLVLDEPTSGLDPLVQDEFHRLLRETIAEGRTVFLSSHELAEVQRIADRVAIVREGRLVLCDSVRELRHRAPHIVELRFKAPVARTVFESLDGVERVVVEDDRVSLQATGELAPLLRVIAEHEPVDLVTRNADLDELFLTYYRTETLTDDMSSKPDTQSTDAN